MVKAKTPSRPRSPVFQSEDIRMVYRNRPKTDGRSVEVYFREDDKWHMGALVFPTPPGVTDGVYIPRMMQTALAFVFAGADLKKLVRFYQRCEAYDKTLGVEPIPFLP
jgi:hypothetical protein